MDRYATGGDLADDLYHFIAGETEKGATAQLSGAPEGPQQQLSFPPSFDPDTPPVGITTIPNVVGQVGSSASPSNTSLSRSQSIEIVPKGLRSFDAHDADFFLELLPGPRDRNGLPDILRFWKSRIEETDSDSTFSVGLIYGPSGCGKSSLVQAGLLPRLSPDVITLYIEATSDETESRMLSGLRHRCPGLDLNLDLQQTMTALRRGKGIPANKKVLIVVDQFEQWLHANNGQEHTELADALRQCDGGRLQCIMMVRDDFWMATTRFLRELEIRLLEGENSNAVELFLPCHAERVLRAYGRAFGELPKSPEQPSQLQLDFVKQAVAGLAVEGKVICVRLAMFAEMMKGKPWTPATLKEVGGTEGVGVTFLEETFSASSAPQQHRHHQQAARAVLHALLPESGTDIKGQMKSYQELLTASGYASRTEDFDDLIRILDTELRLITPTEGEQEAREDVGEVASTNHSPPPSTLFYQLAHDYLVHSLRDWLTRKQKETRRGRAELQLAEHAATWNQKRVNRKLPSISDCIRFRLFTDNKKWSRPQRGMMRRSTRVHAVRFGFLSLLVLIASYTGLSIRHAFITQQNATRAKGLVNSLLNADINLLSSITENLEPLRKWVDPILQSEHERAADGSAARLRVCFDIGYDFAISSNEVTFANFLKFRPQHLVKGTAANSNHPVYMVSWYLAASYCNWLSKQAGIDTDQWVYAPSPKGGFVDGMTIKTDYRELTGYRLPSDAEWNHACRAGTNSMFSYGEPESLMGRYGNTVATSAGLSQDVATLLPNRLGLFDMHGGLWEWCLDSRKGPLSPVRSQVARVQRGGSYGVRPWNARSDRRGGNPATYKDNFVGFRVAQSLPERNNAE